MYFGGLPINVIPNEGTVGSSKPFTGCIADAILNGTILNFANSTDKFAEILGKCILDLTYKRDFPDILIDANLPDIVTLGPYETGHREDGYDDTLGNSNVLLMYCSFLCNVYFLGGINRGDGGDILAGVTHQQPPMLVTTVAAYRPEVATKKPGTPPTTTKKPEVDSCMLPMDPVLTDIPQDSFRFSKYLLKAM